MGSWRGVVSAAATARKLCVLAMGLVVALACSGVSTDFDDDTATVEQGLTLGEQQCQFAPPDLIFTGAFPITGFVSGRQYGSGQCIGGFPVDLFTYGAAHGTRDVVEYSDNIPASKAACRRIAVQAYVWTKDPFPMFVGAAARWGVWSGGTCELPRLSLQEDVGLPFPNHGENYRIAIAAGKHDVAGDIDSPYLRRRARLSRQQDPASSCTDRCGGMTPSGCSCMASCRVFGNCCPGVTHASEQVDLEQATGDYLIMDTSVDVDEDTTLPNGMSVCFPAPGSTVFDIAASTTLTVNGRIEAGPRRIFEYEDDTAAVEGGLTTTIYPEWWGAQIDDAGNDSAAMRRMGKYVSAVGSGNILLQPGTYIVGEQEFGVPNEYGTVNYAVAKPLLVIDDAAGPITIAGTESQGQGTRLRAADRLLFGSFNPNYPPESPVGENCTLASCFGVEAGGFNPAVVAQAYWGMIRIRNSRDVVIRDIELDGNMDGLTLGGLYGNAGYQLNADGILSEDSTNVVIERVHTHHHGRDGLHIYTNGFVLGDPPTPHLVDGVRSEYNARQGMTWGGGAGLIARDSTFSFSGRGRFNSPLSAGVDLESEAGQIEDCEFHNVHFVDNLGYGVERGGVVERLSFDGCLFWGTEAYAANFGIPGTIVRRSKVIGTAFGAYGTVELPTEFHHCRFTEVADPRYPGLPVYSDDNMLHFPAAANVLVRDSLIERTQTLMFWFVQGAIERSQILHRYATPSQEHGVFRGYFWNSRLEDVAVLSEFSPGAPLVPQFYDGNISSMERVYFGEFMRWGGAFGATGCITNPGQSLENCVTPIDQPELIPE